MGELLEAIGQVLFEILGEPLLELIFRGWRTLLGVALGFGLAWVAFHGMDAGTWRTTLMVITTGVGLGSGVVWEVQS